MSDFIVRDALLAQPGKAVFAGDLLVRHGTVTAVGRVDSVATGSALTMDRGMANLLSWLKLPPEQTWAMDTLNPASILGLTNKGRLEPGADADLVPWDEGLHVAMTWMGGRLIHERPV